MKGIGEPLNEEEMKKFEETVLKIPENKPGLVNILALSKLMLPDVEAEVEAQMISGEKAKEVKKVEDGEN
jgi:hypothetical protein